MSHETRPSGNSSANPSPRGNSYGKAQHRRTFLLATAVLTLMLGGARTASAQVTFGASGGLRLVRAEGTTEVVSAVVLGAASAGTIKAGSAISFNYGATVEPGTGEVECTPASCILDTNFAVGIAGGVLTITFTTDVAFAFSDWIAVSGVRVDAALGDMSATLSASGANPITFTSLSVLVARGLAPATDVSIAAASPLSVCSPSAKSFSVEVGERFPGAFTSAQQESDAGNVGAPGVDPMGAGELDTTVRLAFTNIPEDVTITFTDFSGTSGTLTPATSFTSFTATSGSQSVNVDVALTATTNFSIETLVVNFTASATAYSPGTGSVSVSLRGGDATPNVPRFAPNVQGSGNVLSVFGPTIFAVVNGASFVLRAVAAGSQAALFGSCLATGFVSASMLPLPTDLGGTSVLFNGTAAPLSFTSSGQINLQIPWELAGETQASVVVNNNGVTSEAFILQLAPTDPGIFALNSSGTGQGFIVNQDSFLNSAANPAAPGSVIQIICTGLGAVSNQPASGAAAPSDPLATTTATPTVSIGGLPAMVTFSGLLPGASPHSVGLGNVGVYHVNVQVPNAPGGAVSVVLTIGGLDSNTVTMHIARRRKGQVISE